jgi:hypothetical protein
MQMFDPHSQTILIFPAVAQVNPLEAVGIEPKGWLIPQAGNAAETYLSLPKIGQAQIFLYRIQKSRW